MHPISDFSALRGVYENAFFPTDKSLPESFALVLT